MALDSSLMLFVYFLLPERGSMVEVGVLLRMLNLLVQPWLLKDGWMDGWMDGWFRKHGWVDGWMV